jgi:hypothetical protein
MNIQPKIPKWGFVGNPNRFGGPPNPFGGPPNQFGGPPNQFGGPPNPFGGPPNQFGGPRQGFGLAAVAIQPAPQQVPNPFGGPPNQFGGPPNQFGGPRQGFGLGGPQPAPQQVPNPFAQAIARPPPQALPRAPQQAVLPPITITLNGYPQVKEFYKFMDNLKKPNYWVSPIFINYALGSSISSLMDIIRFPDEKKKYIKAITEGGFKKVFDFIVPVGGHNGKFIIKFESMSDLRVLNKWCYDDKTCNFLPSVDKSEKYKDNYNSTSDNVKTKRVCIVNTPSQIVESFYSLLNSKYFKDGVSPCLLKTYLTSIINNEACTKKDIECLASSTNSNDYNACIGASCNSIPLFNDGFVVDLYRKKLNGSAINYTDGRYVLTIQEKVDGDLMYIRNSIPDGFTTGMFNQTLLHICLTLHILQVKNCLMHNDFWFRNVFYAATSTNDRNCVNGVSKVQVPLNEIKYYHYNLLNVDGSKKDIYIKQLPSSILPIISDFGFSEFVTDSGEYIYNGDFGNRNPCKNIPGGKINFLWYPDIVLFLTTTLHTLFNNRDNFKPGMKIYECFINTWQLTGNSVKECIDDIQQSIINNDSSSRHKNIIITIILSLSAIFGNSTLNIAKNQYANPRGGHGLIGLNLYEQLNYYWSNFFYPNEPPGTKCFDLWLLNSNQRSVRMNFKNYGTANWLINNTYKTILPFALSLFEYLKDGSSFTDVKPNLSKSDMEDVLDIVVDKAVPRFTENLEKTRDEYLQLMRNSFKPAPTLSIDGVNYGPPSYIKPIDVDSDKAKVIFYSYENIRLSGLSNSRNGVPIDGDGKNYQGYDFKQYINLIVIQNPSVSTFGSEMSFERKQLMETLKDIFKLADESKTDYVKTGWGVAFSGGFFKHIDYTSPSQWKHCNNIKNDTPDLVKTTKCFQPIGYIREKIDGTNLKVSYNQVPDLYRNVYGSVCISGDDTIKIVKPYINNAATNPECNFVLASGPILTLDNKIEFNNDLLQNPIYQGSMQNPATMYPSIVNNGRKSMIYLAGWLNHAFNLNPRAAIGLDSNKNIFLVTIEGRDQRGSGCDLTTLAKIMKSFGCVSSVNLDGGGTADLLYKLPQSGCYVQTNPVHLYKYPLMSLENSSAFKFQNGGVKSRGGKKNRSKFNKKITQKIK